MTRQPTILLLTGTCGVGKSTVARIWARRHEGVAVDCDQIRHWIHGRGGPSGSNYQEALVPRLVAGLCREFVEAGFRSVALDHVWTPDSIRVLRERLGADMAIHVVWLSCAADENRARDGSRHPDQVMGDRVSELREELELLDWPDDVMRLETTGQDPMRTVDAIDLLARTGLDGSRY